MTSKVINLQTSGSLFLLVPLLTALVLAGCSLLRPEEKDLAAPADDHVLDAGTADFSRYVSLGNSITAGYQSGSLYASTQRFGYAALLARAMELPEFELPLVADPGFFGTELSGSEAKGHLRLVFEDHEPVVENLPWPPGIDHASQLYRNQELAGPYHNLAVPGAVTFDLAHSLNSEDCYTAILTGEQGRNPYFDIVLRNASKDWTAQGGAAPDLTVLDQAILLAPTFMTLWIGNNELLLPATEGKGIPLYDAEAFALILGEILDILDAALPATALVLAKVPPVTAAPFFTTLDWQVVDADGETALDPATGHPLPLMAEDRAPSHELRAGDLVLLDADEDIDAGMGIPVDLLLRWIMSDAGVDSADAAALLPERYPLAGQLLGGDLTLIAEEVASLRAATLAYNAVIDTSAARRGHPVVDTHALLERAAAEGVEYEGLILDSEFAEGGLFSLDGVHPSNFGHAVLARAFMEVINERYGSNLRPPRLVDLLPESMP